MNARNESRYSWAAAGAAAVLIALASGGSADVAAARPVTWAEGARATGADARGDHPCRRPSTARQDPDVRELLSRAESTYEALGSLRARFTQTIDIPLLERSRTGSGIWYQKGRGRFKMEFLDPEGDLIVADGVYLWLYYPATNPGQVIRSTIEANPTGAQMVDLQGRIFQDARTIYDAVYVGEERVTGRPAHHISLTPREASPYRRVRVWVDAESYLVRKFEILEENETVRTVEMSDLEPNVAIADQTFFFQLPSGVDVFQG